MNAKELEAFLVEHQDKDRAWLVANTGRSARWINEKQAELRIKGLITSEKSGQGVKKAVLTPEQQFELEMETLRVKREEKSQDKKLNFAMKELAKVRSELDALGEMVDTISTYEIKPRTSQKYESVAVAVASDWHVGENVKPETVDFTNEYTMRIAKKRAEAFFRNTVKLVQKEQQDTNIQTLVLALLGDFISGNIHEELLESCEVPPIEEAMFAQNLLASGIEYILANTKLELIVPCCVGNHSRITDKVHVSTEQGNSLEWMIYNNLAIHFAKNKRVKFVLSKGYFTFVDVFGYLIRFHHGHAIKFGGGIGGLTVPVIKAIARYDLDRKATLDVFGHFHNRIDGGKFIVNGSLIGDAPYGKRLGFTGRPEQAFFLVQKGYGKTIVAPIFVE